MVSEHIGVAFVARPAAASSDSCCRRGMIPSMRGLLGLIVAFVFVAFGSSASAATFIVTGFGDRAGATCKGTSCASLRAAVLAAEQVSNAGSTVSLGAGTYALGGSGSAGGPLAITADMTIAGAGESATTIEQTSSGDGVVQITSPVASVTVSDLTITGGDAVGISQPQATPPNPGVAGGDAVGGILDDGALTLDRVSVSGNKASGGAGGATVVAAPGMGGTAVGGIDVVGSLTLDGSAVTSDTAIGGAGGECFGNPSGAVGGPADAGVLIEAGAGAVTITGSDLSSNVATGGAGGISLGGGSVHDGAGGAAYGALVDLEAKAVTVTRSSLNGNTVTGGAGGTDATVSTTGGAGGTAAGGGVYDVGGAISVSDSAIDGNAITGGAGGASMVTSGAAGGALGGGLAVISPATLSVDRATVGLDTALAGAAGPTSNSPSGAAANGADAQGAGAYLAATSVFVDVTLAKDVVTGSAGGAANSPVPAGLPGRGIGGGISVQPPGALTLASDTLAADAVQAGGGGAIFGGDLDDGNVALTVSDTIFSGGIGSPTTGTCAIFNSAVTDAGHNLESTTPSQCGLTSMTDLVGTDPQLGAFTDNGGPGPTFAPRAASLARGAGGACTDPSQAGDPPLATDERGAPRHAQCDIGAYETRPPTVTNAPVLSGPAVVGTRLSCPTTGFAGDAPLSFSFIWRRGGTVIVGATSASYTLTSTDVGQSIACSVTATNVYGSVTATSGGLTGSRAPARFTGASLRSTHLTKDGKGHITLTLVCPAGTPGRRCSVEVALYARTGPLPAAAARHGTKAPRPAGRLARASVVLTAGHSAKLTLTLTAAGRRVTRHPPTLIRVLLTSHDAAGTVVTRSVHATVRNPKRRRQKR
jgi:hypothetical protein